MTVPYAQPQDHSKHKDHGASWVLGGLGVITALSLAPFILPMIGIGNTVKAGDIMHRMGEGGGTGIAGGLQDFIGGFPGGDLLTSTAPALDIGGFTIAAGTIATLGATLVIGIGGVMLANWMEKNEKQGDFPWSKVVRFAAIGTSALIALPGILGAISIGISFIGSLFGSTVIENGTFSAMYQSLGATSMHTGAGGAANSVAASLVHLLDCGVAALPLVGTYFANKAHGQEKPQNRLEQVDFRQRLRDTHQLAVSQ